MKRKIDKLIELRSSAQNLLEKLNNQIDETIKCRNEVLQTAAELDRLIWKEMELEGLDNAACETTDPA